MSLTGTEVTKDYQGNGVTTDFPISFSFQDNGQVSVKKTDLTTNEETLLVEGTDFEFLNGDPATAIRMDAAPSTNDLITVYRVTPRTQTYDYIGTGPFKAEDHEKIVDRIVMMIQEIDLGILANAPAGTGKFTRLSAQAVAAGGTVSVGTAQRMLKNIQGDGSDITADTTTAIAAGTIDGQELRLVGASDDQTVSILDTTTNVKLNGTMTFKNNSVLDLFYDLNEAVWKEVSRRE